MDSVSRMRASHLFGTLEAPGQKAYPSKDIDYWKLNPKQPSQIEQVTVQKKLSNGRVWTMGGEMPLTTTDTFPRLNPEGTWRHLSQGTGSFGSPFKASNPETITSFGILPTYPEEEAMKAALMSRPKVMAQQVGAREEFPKAEKPEFALPKISSKFTPEKLEKLAAMGIPEELIGKAIEEELKKDMMAFLNNPALLAEVQTTEAIQQIYEKYVIKQKSLKTGENAGGDAPGAGAQNVGVRAYAAPAQLSMLSPKQQRLAELRASEFGGRDKSVLAGMEGAQPSGMASLLLPRMPNMGAGPGGGGLSDGPLGMLAGSLVTAAEKAQAQEAANQEAYMASHSLMENSYSLLAVAAMAPERIEPMLRLPPRKGGIHVRRTETGVLQFKPEAETQSQKTARRAETYEVIKSRKETLSSEGIPVFKKSKKPGRPRKE